MMHLRLLTLLALLTAAATGAWADDTFSTSPYETDQQFNNRVTVAANTTLTINKGVTVTAKAGLNIQSGATLTVTGGGTLEIHNRDGADGINAFDDEEFPISSSSGDPGSDAIEGGGTLSIDDATVIAIGSNGGKGGKAHGRRQASDGGDGGYGVSGVIVTIISGSITVLGGSGGEGGAGSSYCAAGSAGADSKGFKTFPTIPGATICWSDNGSDWTPYENNTGETKRYMKAYYYPPTYSVKMKDGTKDAANWTISTGSGDNVRTATGSDADGLKGLYEGDAVTLKYSGRRKVKSVTATTDAAPAAYTMAANATAGDVGKLICTDGHIHTYNADAACTKSRVAMIAYVGIETGVAGYTHGLALALTDEGNNNWNNAKTACTNKNTSATVKSASWMLPSRTQWETMGATNSTYTTLRNGFTSVGGSNLDSFYYWSSTEHEDHPIYAWYFDFNLGSWVWDYKDLGHLLVRACLAF